MTTDEYDEIHVSLRKAIEAWMDKESTGGVLDGPEYGWIYQDMVNHMATAALLILCSSHEGQEYLKEAEGIG